MKKEVEIEREREKKERQRDSFLLHRLCGRIEKTKKSETER